MGQVISINQARFRRQLPIAGPTAYLEQRIAALLEHLDDGPEVTAEILRLRNEIWLMETMTWLKGP